MASSLKRHKARTPFLFHPDRKCILVSPSWAGCSGIFKIDGAGPGRLSYVPHAGWMLFWDSGRARSGRPPLPRGPRACSGAAAAGAGPGGPGAAGAGGRGPRECGDRDPSALRLRLEARVRPPGAERPRVRACVCVRPRRRRARGRGPRPPPHPSSGPPPAPSPLLGLAAWLCSVRRSARSGFGYSSASRFGSGSRSGSRSDAAALELWLGRRGGRTAPPLPA